MHPSSQHERSDDEVSYVVLSRRLACEQQEMQQLNGIHQEQNDVVMTTPKNQLQTTKQYNNNVHIYRYFYQRFMEMLYIIQ